MVQDPNQIQQLAEYYQELSAQLEAMQEEISYLEKFQSGMTLTRETIEAIRDSKKDEEIILPIGNAAFIRARIVDPEIFLISIGKDVLVEKSPNEALLYAQKVEEKNAQAKSFIEQKINEIKTEMGKIEPTLQNYLNMINASRANLKQQQKQNK